MCTYLDQVGATYYFRRAVPQELQSFLLTDRGNPRTEFKISLRTKVREGAKRKLPHYVQLTDRLFDEARKARAASEGATGGVRGAPQIDGQWIGEFAAEEAAFAARKAAERSQRRLQRAGERDRLREKLHPSTDQMPERYAAIRDLIREAEERGARAALLSRNTTSSEAAQRLPAARTDARTRKGHSTRLNPDLVDLWAAERRPQAKTIDAHRAVAQWFMERVGDIAVADITREHALAFKEALLAEGQKAANVRVKLSRLRTLTNWAFANDYASVKAADGIKVKIPRAEQAKRRPYDLASLRAIFESPVFARGERPSAGRGEAAYWLPLLALYTGARLEELAQLRYADVHIEKYMDASDKEAEAWVISIQSRTDEGHLLKTEDSERLVPIHADIIELGFLEFVHSCKDNEGGRLFHLLKPNKYGIVSAKWGEWFSRYRRTVCKIEDRRLVFHSFRHTFKDMARHCGIPQGVQRQLMGHSPGDVPEEYGEGQSVHQLVRGIRDYRVPGLKLSTAIATEE